MLYSISNINPSHLPRVSFKNKHIIVHQLMTLFHIIYITKFVSGKYFNLIVSSKVEITKSVANLSVLWSVLSGKVEEC